MGVFEIFSIIMLIITAGIFIWKLSVIVRKSHYIRNTANKIRIASNELTYRTDGDILELYYKENKIPFKYTVVGNKNELAEILDMNYQQY